MKTTLCKSQRPSEVWQCCLSKLCYRQASIRLKFCVRRSFLDPDEPFSVPSQLREQVADFESQYSGQRGFSRSEHVLDNSSDPTKKTLYEYVKTCDRHIGLFLLTGFHDQ